ncbi:hypothetical protein KPH14_008561 [Odynerus spinipes]|uniref:Peroxidase n=1 Tax=Odynerus spinipes TaxID=1348599 RepID=A0AAD9RSI9_9HYME|nr:hypothetical protein KPH14_008561 [Odynerus spinipes]
MLGGKASRLAWFLLVAVVFDLGITAVHAESSKASRRTRERGSSKRRFDDLESAESSYGSFFGYPNSVFNEYSLFIPNSNPPALCRAYPNGQRTNCGDAFNNQCRTNRYRTFDGSCNNLNNPMWGAANTRYGRLLLPKYGDGIQAPTRSVTGSELPLSRLVSFTLFPSVTVKDNRLTLAAMQWGQFITHDMAMIDGSTQSKKHVTQCCTDDGCLLRRDLSDPKCYPIVIPYNDPVYRKSTIECLEFVRSVTDLDRGCNSRYKSAAEQLTVVTHYLDLSLVYGSNQQVANNLRLGIAGRMRVDVRSNREWPPTPANKSALCDVESSSDVCYDTGDVRANQNPQLTVLHILLLREHNRIAGKLARLNPHWSDETIYQETRRIVIAEHQHISYYEWLPLFLGSKQTRESKILYDTNDYVNDYNPRVDPSVLNEHSTAAFRYFHSLIAGFLKLIGEQRGSVSPPLRLSDHFNRPAVIEQDGNMDHLTRGLSYQPEMASDQYFDEEITIYLFRNGRRLGSDLRATDIQRNRDHGLASYNDYREYCHLPRANNWNDFKDYISEENIQKLASLYAHPDDVDLTVGGSLERDVPGTLVGPTFLCILLEQFYRTRVGDRFWYENSNQDTAFTKEQLNEIRKASISRLFCDNGDNIELMQPKGFELVSDRNPLYKCQNLPSVDLSFWKDYAQETRSNEDHQTHYVYYKKK